MTKLLPVFLARYVRKALSTLATTVAEFGDKMSPFLAIVAEIGELPIAKLLCNA